MQVITNQQNRAQKIIKIMHPIYHQHRRRIKITKKREKIVMIIINDMSKYQ